MATGARLSSEEFTRLHEQLLQLKIQNSELEEGNRPMRQALLSGAAGAGPAALAAGAPAPQVDSALPPATPPSSSALGRSLAANMKNAFGARAANSGRPSASAPLEEGGGGGGDGAAGGSEDAAEEMRQEVVSLHHRLRKASEELSAARAEMKAAQQAAMTAQAAAAKAAGTLPDVAEVRRRLVAPDDQAELQGVDDTAVLRIAMASLKMAPRPEVECEGGGQAAGAPGACGGEPGAEERMMLALQKIQAQQKDLERLRMATDRQQAQVRALQEQAAVARGPSGADQMQQLEQKLRTAERQTVDLIRRIGASSDASGQIYELQCHLRAMADRVRQRESAIEKARLERDKQEASHILLRERLALCVEDVHSHRAALDRGDDAERDLADIKPAECSAFPGEGQPGRAEVAAPAPVEHPLSRSVESVAAGVQVELGAGAEDSDPSLEALETSLKEVQVEKVLLEKRCANEVQELRGQVRGRKRLQQAAADAAAARAEAIERGEDADDRLDGRVIGSLYNQKIIELQELNAGLEEDLELLKASVQCLRADLAAKEDLISDLMRSAAGSEDAPAAQQPKRDGVLSQLWSLSGLKDARQEQEESAELKRLAEAACLDNMRLRNDLKRIGEEYRRTIETAGQSGAAAR